MTLIKSISGIRGTVGGAQAGNLTPPDVVSQLLLAVPTWILFEIGLLIAARQQKRREAAAAAELDDAVLDVYRQDNES